MFNGEIYNHHELRRELIARGHVFRTTSDTEVILHAYEEYGAACVERLRRHVRVRRSTTRRRASCSWRAIGSGKKPLFYAVLGGALHFASEIKALVRRVPPGTARSISTASKAISRSATILAPEHDLPPRPQARARPLAARAERPDRDRAVLGRRASSTTITPERPALVQPSSTTLLRAGRARDRLESEVPLGAFLSGGIDSGLVVSFMAEAMAEPVRHDVGRVRGRAAQRAGRGGAHRARASQPRTHARSSSRASTSVLDRHRRRVRRAVRRCVGDSDLLRVADGRGST